VTSHGVACVSLIGGGRRDRRPNQTDEDIPASFPAHAAERWVPQCLFAGPRLIGVTGSWR